jgi:hypothetical protein
VGAAAALSLTEGYIALVVTLALGMRVFDRRALVVLAKTAAVCLFVIGADRLALSSLGLPRLAADALLYAVLALAWGAVDRRVVADLLVRLLPTRVRSHASSL